MYNILSLDSLRYLQSRPSAMLSSWLMLLISVHVYAILTDPEPYPHSVYLALLEIIIAVVVLLQRARWLVYALLLIALVIHLFAFTQIIAEGGHDSGSTRDDAVEVTTKTLLSGENAWNANPGVPATTGPTSILLAVPFILIFGKINWLSFGFWLLFFLILLWYDIQFKNNTWLLLVMFLFLGLLGLEHTLYWSLEELYYPMLFFPLAFVLRKQEWGVGALAAAAILARLNYAFLWIGFGLWYLSVYPLNIRKVFRMSFGFLIATVVILLPFVLVGQQDLVDTNPWKYALGFSIAKWPDTNALFHTLNQLSMQVGADVMRWLKFAVTLLLILGVAWRLNSAKVSHPFWHIATAAFVAHTIFWLSAYPWSRDYSLMFVLPAMLAISMTRIRTSVEIAEG